MDVSSVGRAVTTAATASTPAAKSGFPTGVKLLTGGIATLVLGAFAYAGFKLIQGGTTGYPLAESQRAAFRDLDHSRDGVLQLDPSIQEQEFIRFESHDDDEDSMLDDYWTVHDESAKLVAADTDGNAEVTAEEFQALLGSYDANGNDKINFSEAGKLEQALPSVEVDRSGSYPGFDYPYVPTTPLPTGPGDD